MKAIVIILFLIISNSFNATSQVVKKVVLDSVMVVAVRSGFSVPEFIEMVKSDTSFYRGFINLRNTSHNVEGYMTVFGKKKKVKSTRYRKAIQHTSEKRRWVTMIEEKSTGDFYKRNDEPGTYTAEIFDDLFFYGDTLLKQDPSAPIKSNVDPKNDNNIDKLKQLVFSPGSEVAGVPIIGKRMAIFNDDRTQYYDYSISVESYADSISCYVFSCKEKKGSGDEAVIKYLNTWFDRKTFNIVYRDYHLLYSGMLFDFDVTIAVKMGYLDKVLYPTEIKYTGYWDIPLRKEERVDFLLEFELLQ